MGPREGSKDSQQEEEHQRLHRRVTPQGEKEITFFHLESQI
jgi:hypothetical protein